MPSLDQSLQSDRLPTRLAGLSLAQTVMAMLALFLVLGLCLKFYTPYELKPVKDSPYGENLPPSDFELYRLLIDRVREGAAYYDVLAEQLRARGYDSTSVMNWRTPLHFWLLSRLPGPAFEKSVFMGLVLLTVVVCFRYQERTKGLRFATFQTLILAPSLSLLGEAYLLGEAWAGVLILFSIVLSAGDRHLASATAGLAALFLRELALPYVLVCLVLAQLGRRTQERNLWLGGLIAYTLYYLLHTNQVVNRLSSLDHNYSGSWLQLRGLSFVLQTATCGPISLLPNWAVALVITLAILGITTQRGQLPRRVLWTASLYVVLFSIFGKSFNTYWGLIYSPLLTFGLAWSPESIQDLRGSLKTLRHIEAA